MGRRSLGFSESCSEKNDLAQDDLQFLGFCSIKNALKEESVSTINILKQAMIEVKIVTGDNIFTAISIAE
jgi:P-type E1-E2 ATPase